MRNSISHRKRYYNFRGKSLGKFFIDIDSIPPKLFRSKRLNYKNQLQYYVVDKETGIKNYRVKINDAWALFEYEPKLNKIFFKNDTLINYGKVNKIEVFAEELVIINKIFQKSYNIINLF